MEKDFVAHFSIEKGRIVWKSEEYMRHWLPLLDGKKGVLSIKRKYSKRSVQQNRYYWKCLGLIGEHTGNTPEELHHIFKGLFAPKRSIQVGSRTLRIPKGTSEMTISEMMQYMEMVGREAASLGVVLMTPEEYYQSEGYES